MRYTKYISAPCLIVLLGLGSTHAAEKERPRFSPGPISSFEVRQTIDQVTVAARPFLGEADLRAAFGKLNPNDHGVLPILVVIANESDQTLSLESVRVELMTPDRRRLEATPAADLKYLSGPPKPDMTPGPIPGRSPRLSRRKSPLSAWEIEGRAFSARMLPARETASGFFYFQTRFRGGSTLFLTGIRQAQTGKELFYFELPLESQQATRSAGRRATYRNMPMPNPIPLTR